MEARSPDGRSSAEDIPGSAVSELLRKDAKPSPSRGDPWHKLCASISGSAGKEAAWTQGGVRHGPLELSTRRITLRRTGSRGAEASHQAGTHYDRITTAASPSSGPAIITMKADPTGCAWTSRCRLRAGRQQQEAEDLNIAIGTAFVDAAAGVEEFSRRRRGEVKTPAVPYGPGGEASSRRMASLHSRPPDAARSISTATPCSKDSRPSSRSEVRFVEEQGIEGPQARHRKPCRKVGLKEPRESDARFGPGAAARRRATVARSARRHSGAGDGGSEPSGNGSKSSGKARNRAAAARSAAAWLQVAHRGPERSSPAGAERRRLQVERQRRHTGCPSRPGAGVYTAPPFSRTTTWKDFHL